MADVQTCQMLIGGAWVAASDGRVFDSMNPATGEVSCRVPEATGEDVDRAVRAADRAFNQGLWAGFQAVYDSTRPEAVWMTTSDAPLGNPFVAR